MVVIRRLWPAVATAVVLAVAVVAIVLTHQPEAPLSTRVEGVAKTLRCPTCAGESVAASDTPIAQSMRSEIRHQLQAGRTPDQVRAWFAERYGAGIVTSPSAHGAELLLWTLPVVVLALGVLVLLRRSGEGSRDASDPGSEAQPVARRGMSGRRVLIAVVICTTAGAAVPAAFALPSRSGGSTPQASAAADRLGPAAWVRVGHALDRQGNAAGAEGAYRRALARDPRSAAARTRLAFDLLRDHRLAAAERLVRDVSGRPGHFRALALLVRGLAERGRGEPRAAATLQEFLRLSPHGAASSQVRRLLGGR